MPGVSGAYPETLVLQGPEPLALHEPSDLVSAANVAIFMQFTVDPGAAIDPEIKVKGVLDVLSQLPGLLSAPARPTT